MPDQERNRSYWFDTAPRAAFPRIEGRIEVDVAIVGGGIVGIMTARQLKDEGLTVAVVEARQVGGEVTGKSTAKITSQHNVTLTKIARKFGEEGARLYGEANQAGLQRIRALAAAHGLDCALETKPAFSFTRDEAHVGEIEEECALAARLGLPASLTRDTGLPFEVLAAMRWDDQAQFHPVRFVAGLAATLEGGGSHVFEGSRVTDWDPRRIATAEGEVVAKHLVMATHMPLGQIGFFYAEAYPHIHPVIMGRADPARVPNGMYISVETPRHSVREHRDEHGQDWLIFAGPAFKAGHVDEERANFADLERFAMDHFGVSPDHRWTNEDYTPMDGAPFIGWSSSLPNPYLVATGFNAWGITNGAAAAILITDLIAGRSNPWLRVFDATRVKPIAGGAQFAKGTAEVASHLVGGYMASKPKEFAALAPGDAAILKVDGDNIAAFKDEAGRIHAVSAACTHMGCLVGWNETDRTWDCPCHGSRFTLSGEVLHGPAVQPLKPWEPD